MDTAQHPHTFPRLDAGNDVYVLPYKHIFRLHPQHMCRRSCHSHQSTTANLFRCAFRHFSFLCFIFFSVHISVSNFQLFTAISSFKYYAFYLLFSFPTLYSQFLLFFCSFRFEAHTHHKNSITSDITITKFDIHGSIHLGNKGFIEIPTRCILFIY